MKTLRKILFVVALVLVLGLVQSLIFTQMDLFGEDSELIFNVFAGGVLVFFIPFILFHKSNDFRNLNDDELVVSDDINDQSDDRSLLAIVAVRSIILIVLLIALDAYINTNGVPMGDGTMDPSSLAYALMALVFLIVLPILLFYNTPLTHVLKNSFNPKLVERKHRPSAYSVNPENHSDDHVFEKDDYNDTTIRCPHCNSASISAYKKNDAINTVLNGEAKNILALFLGTDLYTKKSYVCLNCNRKW